MTDHAVNEWTRNDLPDHDVIRYVDDMHGDGTRSRVIDLALDTVVGHLNANHQKPGPDLWRRAHSITEQERDTARRERDEWKARAEAAEHYAQAASDSNRDNADRASKAERERDEWRSRAEAAEARTTPAVTKADIEKAIRGKTWAANREPNMAGFHRVHIEWATDAVWSLVSGADPVVYVVRESDLPEVERDEDGDWLCENLVVNHRDTAEELRGRALSQLKHVAMREAVARAIEAEQATDPVEDKARELYEHVYVGRFEDGSSGVQTEYRKLAAYLLGQEADQ